MDDVPNSLGKRSEGQAQNRDCDSYWNGEPSHTPSFIER